MELPKYDLIDVWVITPEVAGRLLKGNTNNRPVRTRHLKNLVETFKAGKFEYLSTIMVDWNGEVVDGQHRLIACRESGVSFPAIVVTGVDPETRKWVDNNAGRSKNDILGFLQLPKIGDMIRVFRELEEGLPVNSIRGSSNALDVSWFEGLDESTKELCVWAHRQVKGKTPHAGTMAAVLAHLAKISFEDAEEFFVNQFVNKLRLEEDSPAYTLCRFADKWLEDNKASRNVDGLVYAIFYCWNAYRDGRKVRRMLLRDASGRLKRVKPY